MKKTLMIAKQKLARMGEPAKTKSMILNANASKGSAGKNVKKT